MQPALGRSPSGFDSPNVFNALELWHQYWDLCSSDDQQHSDFASVGSKVGIVFSAYRFFPEFVSLSVSCFYFVSSDGITCL
jgi:hypothetical protein